jgi:hypothetical protein
MVHNRPVEVPLCVSIEKGSLGMKRSWKVAAAGVALTAAVATSGAFAANDVADTSQKGSLLMYARIDVRQGFDTIVRITNDNNKAVDVKCYYMNERKGKRDFGFTLTKKQPAWWSVVTGDGTFSIPNFPNNEAPGLPAYGATWSTQVGELICWAVSKTGHNQISFNHLFGSATVYDFRDTANIRAFEYNSWNFRAHTAVGTTVGTEPGRINLNGTEYDFCPGYLVAGFTPRGANVQIGPPVAPPATPVTVQSTENFLSVIACNQDLRQDYVFHFTKLEFTVWNEDESKFTGAYECADSYHFLPLSTVDVSPEYFDFPVLGTSSAFFQVRGVASARCNILPTVISEAAGLVGVLSTSNDETGTTLNAAGTAVGYVRWDADHHPDVVPEKQ